jgi:hypothetical protein
MDASVHGGFGSGTGQRGVVQSDSRRHRVLGSIPHCLAMLTNDI